MKNRYLYRIAMALGMAFSLAPLGALAQTAAATPAPASDSSEPKEDLIVLSPFEVSASDERGYTASTTLAGNRLNTAVRDIGNAVTVITSQFLTDIGATDNATLLQYTTGTEVGSVYGNFSGNGDGSTLDESPHFINPNNNTRVRGLTSADNTRDYFLTDIPWEGYNIDGVDLQRGPNSILFGQGSPAGIINTRTRQASYKDSNEVTLRVGSFGTTRETLDINKVLIKNELAIRLDLVNANEKFREKPAFSKSERGYGAVRWEPGFLKKGMGRTIIKADFEVGKVNSNNPRDIPPIDKITPWFFTGTTAGTDSNGNPFTYPNLNRITVTPQQNMDGNTGLPNHGTGIKVQGGPQEIKATNNPYYQPWMGNFGNQFGNPTFNFNGDSSSAQGQGINWEPGSNHGIGPDGKINTSGLLHFQRPGGVAGYAQYALNAGLKNSDKGVYKDKTLTDPSVFDFYNLLLDGPNKKEWQNFRTYNVSLAQTFFHDQIGFEAIYNREWYKNGQISLLDGNGTQAIGIDVNSVYPDGTNNGLPNVVNGTPNPNVGRPYLSSSSKYTNNSYVSNRTSRRLTVFAKHNFDEGEHRNWFTKAIGEHTITGLANEDIQTTDNRSWQRYGTDAAYETFVDNFGTTTKTKFTSDSLTPNSVIYLGPSLASATSAAGAHIKNPSALQSIAGGSVYAFDSTWNRPTDPTAPGYVDPKALWIDNYTPQKNPASPDGLYRDGSGNVIAAGQSTQSANPANYIGFRAMPITVIDSEKSAANRDLLTHDARLTKSQLTSTAATWQGHFWDNFLVATYGVRKDISRSWSYSENINGINIGDHLLTPGEIALSHPSVNDSYGHLNLTDGTYHLDTRPDTSLQVTSHAWTAVAHLNQLPVLKRLPVQVSLFYNHSTDFQPASQRVDAYGQPLSPPSGETKDYGILIESLDSNYSLKINKYTTTSTNATSSALGGAWFIGASQVWSGNWVNRFDHQWFNYDDARGANNFTAADWQWNAFNYEPAPASGSTPAETAAQAHTRMLGVISAWRAWQKSVDPRFYAAWGINLNDTSKAITSSNPNGFAVTEDSVSKGYEIELSALPTKNWRLTVNASKTEAQRTNIGGTALSQFITSYEKALKTTPVGDLRIWWGGAGADTALKQWNGNEGAEWALRKLQEGTNVPELREWRFNGITNYSFDHGILKGVNVGGGVRYESPIVIGYKLIPGATANDINFDLTSPYKGPADTNFDFWVGYGHKFSKYIDWSIQLNVRNAFVGNELITLTTEPDGSPATSRIRPPQTWQLTNTFKF
jgi:outer membrane receptor protein involved in Fe transport